MTHSRPLGLVLLVAALVACQGGPRITLRTAALYPTLAPVSECRLQVDDYTPQRGHVVLIEVEGTQTKTPRRIVGVAGDRVMVRGGALYIDGETAQVGVKTERTICMAGMSPRCQCRITEEEVGDRRFPVQSLLPVDPLPDDVRCLPGDEVPEVVVPAEHVYLLADNRDAALDSRALGPIPIAQLHGRVVACTP